MIDLLEYEGVISQQDGKNPRRILMSAEEFENKYMYKSRENCISQEKIYTFLHL